MAILKCKMCGGDLNVSGSEKIVECEFCGTTQTIPDGNDEKKTNLFNRANRLRLANEFDKAAVIYESIIAEFPDEAECYWGLCLCKFGIEYVDDPKTAKKIPTCHRTSFESIFDDANFKAAIEKADVVAQSVYKEEAATIDKLQKDILSIVHNEKPFDVFICYKETNELGERTQDSVFAQDIYDALTEKGLKVFFSRITLEDKLGSVYEPYIFAALNSAKVMLAIGTKEEYYNAVWVKNEWSRFLALMENDKEKTLIPCYRDIDPYDMPPEFKNLQGQDMSKLGFLQDLTRGVLKIVRTDDTFRQVNVVAAGTGALTKRGYLYLEDGDFSSADEYFDRALDENPEDSQAYVGRTLVYYKKTTLEELVDIPNIAEHKDFGKAIRFADSNNKSVLESVKESAVKKIHICRLIDDLNRYAKKLKKQEDHAFVQNSLEQTFDLLEVGNFKNAAECCKKILEIDNKCAQAYLGLLMAKLGVRKESELAHCEEPLEIHIEYRRIMDFADSKLKSELQSYNQTITDNKSKKLLPFMKKAKKLQNMIAITDKHTIGLKSDGTVVAVGENDDGRCDVSDWSDIVAVSAGNFHTVGLKSDGTVVAVGWNTDGQCDVSAWSDIVAVSAGNFHTVGLKSDGTVVAVGWNTDGQCDVSAWSDIVAVSAGSFHTVGLKADGTVVAVGSNYYGQCNVSNWKDIVAVSTGHRHTVGLKSDGTVVAVGNNDDGQCDVSKWRDIIAVSTGYYHTVGLKSDGTVVAVGKNGDGQCNVSGWNLFKKIKN